MSKCLGCDISVRQHSKSEHWAPCHIQIPSWYDWKIVESDVKPKSNKHIYICSKWKLLITVFSVKGSNLGQLCYYLIAIKSIFNCKAARQDNVSYLSLLHISLIFRPALESPFRFSTKFPCTQIGTSPCLISNVRRQMYSSREQTHFHKWLCAQESKPEVTKVVFLIDNDEKPSVPSLFNALNRA